MRDWIALHTGVLDSDTWEDLGDHRLAWIVTLLLAAQQSPEGQFDSPEKLRRILAKEDVPFPAEAFAAMLNAGALEVDGLTVKVRGWERWQRRWRGPSDDPAREADRKREAYWREKAERAEAALVSGQSPDSSGRSPIAADRGEEIREEEKRGEGGVPRAPAREATGYPGEGEPDALDEFYALTLHRPWGRPSGRWLLELQGGYGIPAVIDALQAEWQREPRVNDLLSRMDARLSKAADRKRQEKGATAKRRKAPEEGRTDEERALLGALVNGGGQG